MGTSKTPATKRRPSTTVRIRRTARETFGYDELRSGQEAAVAAVLAGHDTLAVMPTGSGKSAIYQIAGALLDGPTVVVSPLIALQRDQVEAIGEQDAAAAAQVNSAISARERRATFADLASGDLEYLFLAPEQLANPDTIDRIRAAKPSLVVVDEAHCVSEWGHDFRPEYLRLGGLVEALGHPTILALTATASPPVRQEIVERLRMDGPEILVHGFDRPNICLAVETFARGKDAENEAAKREALVERVVAGAGPGIVYAATRKRTEGLAAELTARGVAAAAYHAGMSTAARERTQDAFMSGGIAVIVATTAFGMGIDKPDVRFVYHLDISESVDAYYQELGRAGRDGEPAEAVLYFAPSDLDLRRFFTAGGSLDVDETERIVHLVQLADDPVPPIALRDVVGMTDTRLGRALNRLEEVGAVELLPSGGVVSGDAGADPAEAAQAAVHAQDNQRKVDHSRLEMMRGYAGTRACRREYLLNYFGEAFAPPCGNCDNCLAGLVAPAAEADADRPFPLGSRVRHGKWGDGLVVRYDDGAKIVVLFDTVGYRSLVLDLVLGDGLLAPAS